MITAYIIQAKKGDQPMLCVGDSERGTFNQWPLSLGNLARLNAESGAVINAVMGGIDWKHDLGEVVKMWADKNGRTSYP